MRPPDDQLGFSFANEPPARDGYTRWQDERCEALRQMALKLGLPLGHRAEVVRDGTCLKGELRLASEELWIEARRDFHLQLRIDRCTFEAGDIESCVRLD